MSSVAWFLVLLGLVGAERVAELVVSTRNARWSLERGGVETGKEHYPWMVLLHLSLFVGCIVEVVLTNRSFVPWLGCTALLMVALTQLLRWWCITTLGRQWNTRVIVVPGSERVARGPYRVFRHPNYIAVGVEGAALPLVHTAWITAVCFSVLNFWLLRTRLRVEESALASLHAGAAT